MSLRTAYALAIVTLLGAVVGMHNLATASGVPPNRPLADLPLRIGSWSGRTEFIEPGVLAVLGVDEYVLRTYRSPQGRWVGLYVGYYGSQRLSERVHSPRVCLPGTGWVIVDHRMQPVSLGEGSVTVNRVVVEKAGERQLVLYWYQFGERVVAREGEAVRLLAWNALVRRRSDEALVRVNGALDGPVEEVLGHQASFIRPLLSVLKRHLPR
jgi:EpsI family protein